MTPRKYKGKFIQIEKLTREQVERAIGREGVSHPLVEVLEKHQDRITALNLKLPEA